MIYFFERVKSVDPFSFFNFFLFRFFENQNAAVESSGQLKAKRVLLDASIFLIRFDPAIKLEERNTYWLFLQAFY